MPTGRRTLHQRIRKRKESAVPRAAMELEALNRIASDTSVPPLERATAVLVAHQRMTGPNRRCRCGWDKLGQSFAGHQAEALAEVGLL